MVKIDRVSLFFFFFDTRSIDAARYSPYKSLPHTIRVCVLFNNKHFNSNLNKICYAKSKEKEKKKILQKFIYRKNIR